MSIAVQEAVDMNFQVIGTMASYTSTFTVDGEIVKVMYDMIWSARPRPKRTWDGGRVSSGGRIDDQTKDAEGNLLLNESLFWTKHNERPPPTDPEDAGRR